MSAVRGTLRAARYAAPERIGAMFPVAGSAVAAREAAALAARDGGVTAGYFALPDEAPDAVVAAFTAMARMLAREGVDAIMAIKPAPLAFDAARVQAIADAGLPLAFDALTPAQADATHALARQFGGTLALPARWRRSRADAEGLRDGPLRLRLVKGEWADPHGDPADRSDAFLELAGLLAGRAAPVAVATHDPALAEAALSRFLEAGTPVELEQLKGLPQRRTRAIARRLGVRVRPYTAWGPGWWPYALEQALRRPYLPLWALRDRAGLPDRPRRPA